MYKKIIKALSFIGVFCVGSANAGLIAIDSGVQDIWWSFGIAQANNSELRLNNNNPYDQEIGVRFNDLSALSGMQIISAEIHIYRYLGEGSRAPKQAKIEAHEIINSWSESSVMPDTDEIILDEVIFPSERSENGWHAWDITSLASDWVNGITANNGVMFFGSGDASFQKFYSSESLNFGPKLVVEATAIELPEPQSLFISLMALAVFWRFKMIKKDN